MIKGVGTKFVDVNNVNVNNNNNKTFLDQITTTIIIVQIINFNFPNKRRRKSQSPNYFWSSMMDNSFNDNLPAKMAISFLLLNCLRTLQRPLWSLMLVKMVLPMVGIAIHWVSLSFDPVWSGFCPLQPWNCAAWDNYWDVHQGSW